MNKTKPEEYIKKDRNQKVQIMNRHLYLWYMYKSQLL